MATKYTFYVNSDNIQTKSKDKARIKAIMKSFESLGHKAVYVGVGSNIHSKPKKYGCTGKNDVWVCIYGGVCGGTIADQTGYQGFGNWFKNDQLKKAHLMYIFVSSPEGACIDVKTAKKLPKAHDDKFSPKGFTGIPNPVGYLISKGVTWIQDGTTTAICNKIETQNWEGTGFDITGTTNRTVKEKTTKYTISYGFDKSKPFEGYLEIAYSKGSRTGKENSIWLDWTIEAPVPNNRFSSDYPIIWENDSKYLYEIDVLSKIKSAEGDYSNTKNTKYYLKRITFWRKFKEQTDLKSTEEDESKLYNSKTDKSSYKMLLYDLGVFNGEFTPSESLGVNGKTILDGVNTILEKSDYEFQLKYGEKRMDDYINFTMHSNSEENIVHTFNEGYDGDIIGISNVKYAPTKDLVNDCITIYKTKLYENKDTQTYRYTRKAKLGELLRYGEQTHIDNLSENTGYAVATQHSHDALQQYFKPITTFTVKSVGLPPVEINDWVQTQTLNPILTNTYQVASRKINIDVNNRPMIQTEFGLGDIDANIKVKKNLAKQRKKLVRKALDLPSPVQYEDREEDSINDMVWVD